MEKEPAAIRTAGRAVHSVAHLLVVLQLICSMAWDMSLPLSQTSRCRVLFKLFSWNELYKLKCTLR